MLIATAKGSGAVNGHLAQLPQFTPEDFFLGWKLRIPLGQRG
jgi:hypothetical protein